jgi:hypothetical protein
MTKYKIKLNDLEQKGGVDRLKRDGFTREDISKAMYKETSGADQRVRENIMSKLHDKR